MQNNIINKVIPVCKNKKIKNTENNNVHQCNSFKLITPSISFYFPFYKLSKKCPAKQYMEDVNPNTIIIAFSIFPLSKSDSLFCCVLLKNLKRLSSGFPRTRLVFIWNRSCLYFCQLFFVRETSQELIRKHEISRISEFIQKNDFMKTSSL